MKGPDLPLLSRLRLEPGLQALELAATPAEDLPAGVGIRRKRPRVCLGCELSQLRDFAHRRLDPAPVTTEVITSLSEILDRFDVLGLSPEPKDFAQLNIDFFHAILSLTRNEPLREISERLYYRATRIWINSLSRLDLADEIAIFRREVADILAAVRIGDLEAVGHIRRAHISMSFQRLNAIGRGGDNRA